MYTSVFFLCSHKSEHMANWYPYTCPTLMILLGIPSILCYSGSGENITGASDLSVSTYISTLLNILSTSALTTIPNTSSITTTISTVVPSLPTRYVTSTMALSSSLSIAPSGTVKNKNSSVSSPELFTGIIIGILLIALFLLACIIAMVWYIIRARKKHTQFIEVSLHLAI